MIVDFKNKETELVWRGDVSLKLPIDIQQKARLKLRMINAAIRLDNLRVPPANRLEALKGSRKGQYSIRINDQWRICFKWQGVNATDVEIVDYH